MTKVQKEYVIREWIKTKKKDTRFRDRFVRLLNNFIESTKDEEEIDSYLTLIERAKKEIK